MKCLHCSSTAVTKNGHRRGKQNYHCQSCGRQFIECYSLKGYSDEVKQHCLTLYVNGLGFRAIERSTGVNHNTVINWVKQTGIVLADVPERETIPELAQVDELQTFVGSKKQNLDLDGSQWTRSWDFSMGVGRPKCCDLLATLVDLAVLGMLSLHHRWLPSLSMFH